MTNVIWIDPDVDGPENNLNFMKLNELVAYKIYRYKTVQDGINEINNILFEETIIIVSGQLFQEFIEAFQKNINNVCFVPNIIVFTRDINQFLLSLDNQFRDNIINHSFYNSGGVQNDFDKVIEFVQDPKKNKKKLYKKHEPEEFGFDYIDTAEKLALPMFYKYLIEFNEENNDKFYKFLKSNYYEKSEDIKKILDTIENTNLPKELLAKYYARIYTDSKSLFYNDLNSKLRKSERDNYLYFIKVLYEGVKLKSLPFAKENALYRGSVMLKKEIDEFIKYNKKVKFKNLPGPIVFSKAFLSFSKDIEIAQLFFEDTKKNNNFYKVLFTLTKDDSRDDNINYSLSTHADIEKISLFPGEKEVLFFPFSCFAIQNVDFAIENIKGVDVEFYKIGLLYLGKYLKTIEPRTINDNTEDTNFERALYNSGLIEKTPSAKKPGVLIQKFYEYNIKSVNINNPIYQKNAIYPVSPIPRTPSFSPPHQIKTKAKENYENYIIGHFKLTENDINKDIRLINSFENNKRKFLFNNVYDDLRYANENELIDNCEIKINGIKFNFAYFFKFSQPGTYIVEYSFKSNITKTDFLFAECFNLIYLDLSNFICEDVTNMVCMFLECINLKKIKISNEDIRKVEDMNSMFYGCQSLEHLDLNFFNTYNLTNTIRLFYGCKSLKSINLSSLDTQNVLDMLGMFEGCVSLKNLDLSKFHTQNVINMSRMFYRCSSLKELDLSNFNISKLAYMNSMFYGCTSLKKLDISNFKIDNAINSEEMFRGCNSLTMENINCEDKIFIMQKSQYYK